MSWTRFGLDKASRRDGASGAGSEGAAFSFSLAFSGGLTKRATASGWSLSSSLSSRNTMSTSASVMACAPNASVVRTTSKNSSSDHSVSWFSKKAPWSCTALRKRFRSNFSLASLLKAAWRAASLFFASRQSTSWASSDVFLPRKKVANSSLDKAPSPVLSMTLKVWRTASSVTAAAVNCNNLRSVV